MILKFALLCLCFAIFECGKSRQIIETRSTASNIIQGKDGKEENFQGSWGIGKSALLSAAALVGMAITLFQ